MRLNLEVRTRFREESSHQLFFENSPLEDQNPEGLRTNKQRSRSSEQRAEEEKKLEDEIAIVPPIEQPRSANLF